MSYDSNKIRKGIFKLTELKKDSEFVEGATAFCDMLDEHEEPLPKDCLSYAKDVSTRLSAACGHNDSVVPVFLRFLRTMRNRAVLNLPHKHIVAALKSCAVSFTQKRLDRQDLPAVLSFHLVLFDLAMAKTPRPASECIQYFFDLTRSFHDNDDYSDLDIIYQNAIDALEKTVGKTHIDTADAYDYLGLVLRTQGYYKEAQRAFQISKEIHEELLAKGEGNENNLINVLLSMVGNAGHGAFPQKADDIIELLKEKLAQNKMTDAQQGEFFTLIGRRFEDDGDQQAAIQAYQDCLERIRESDASPLLHHRVAIALARVYVELNEPQLVEKFYTEAVGVIDKIPLSNADEVSESLFQIASYYSNLHKFKKSEQLLAEALALKKKASKDREGGIEVELVEKELATVRKLQEEEAENSTKPLETLMDEIEKMVGLHELKKNLRDHGVYLDYLRLRKERGFESEKKPILHAVFTGNPGTGKTTVAKMLGQIYHRLGLLSSGHVHTVVRADLIGAQYASGEKGARRALDAARGGVLFIDEAYTLSRFNSDGEADNRDPGQEVIETLLPVMSSSDSDTAIVVAGYPKEMNAFLDSNPGLRSRFKLFFDFPDYTPPEMIDIAVGAAKRHDIVLSEDAQKVLLEVLQNSYRKRDKSFGNARYVHGLVEECKRSMALRIMRSSKLNMLTNEEISIVTADDVHKACKTRSAIAYHAPVDEKLLAQSLASLDAMVGLDSLKAFVHDFVKVVRVYRELGKDVLHSMNFNLVFSGNPGTGKTVVSRLIAEIYKALGLLERGHLVECGRSTLVGQYIGQSEAQTRKKLEEAMGGVLFVDEAYALSSGGMDNDFGPRAVEVILKEMEDKRGKFFVIFAGYKKEMQQFLDINPGLRSRIDKILDFENYSVQQMEQIAINMLRAQELQVDEEGRKFLRQKLEAMAGAKGFANGRSARSLVERLALKHFASLADIASADRTPEMLSTINPRVIEALELSDLAPKRPVGF